MHIVAFSQQIVFGVFCWELHAVANLQCDCRPMLLQLMHAVAFL